MASFKVIVTGPSEQDRRPVKLRVTAAVPERTTRRKTVVAGDEFLGELRAFAKKDLMKWLEIHKILKERDDLYDAVEMAVELSEMTVEQVKKAATPTKPATKGKRKKGGA